MTLELEVGIGKIPELLWLESQVGSRGIWGHECDGRRDEKGIGAVSDTSLNR